MTVATYYVDADSGSDANDGSIGSPWLTLQYALTNATWTNGVRLVISGTHAITTTLTSSSSVTQPLFLVAGTDCVISWETAMITGNSHWTWDGVSIVHNNSGAAYPTGRQHQFVDCTLTRGALSSGHIIYGMQETSWIRCVIDYGAIYGQFRIQADAYIKDCTFLGDLLVVSVAGKVVIENTKFSGNSSFASMVSVGGAGGSIHLDHCTFVDCDDASAKLVASQGYGLHVTNCVFSNIDNALTSGSYFGLWDGNYQFDTSTIGSGAAFASADSISLIALSADPYPNRGTGDWTPSAELSAIVGSDGLTPGAIQATGGGGQTLAQLQRGIRLGNRGVRA
jgi:hypothetical protein